MSSCSALSAARPPWSSTNVIGAGSTPGTAAATRRRLGAGFGPSGLMVARPGD
jgi:hypothetical protein